MVIAQVKGLAVFVVALGLLIGTGVAAQQLLPGNAPDGKAEKPRPHQEKPEAITADKPVTDRSLPDSRIPLSKAVEDLNRKVYSTGYFGIQAERQEAIEKERRPKPVTVDEVISAIRNWDRKKRPVADSTYQLFQQIADSKTLPPEARLYFHDQWKHPGDEDKYEYRVWRIMLDVMTGKNTGYTFAIREERVDRRVALLPAPGYSWLQQPSPAAAGFFDAHVIVSFEKGKDAALLIAVAWSTKRAHDRRLHDLRVVAFDRAGNRYLPGEELYWGGATPEFVMRRFRVDPKQLPAANVEYVAIEGKQDPPPR